MKRGFGIFLILVMLVLNIYMNTINIYMNTKELEKSQVQVKELQRQIEQLRRDQYQMQEQIKSFLDKWNIEIFEVTAYSPFDNRSGICNDGNPNYTATGTRPAPGTIAVNPKIIPYGTRLWVQGYGWGQALDTGGTIRAREDLIDVFQWTYDDAMKWGRRKAVVVWQN